ncbi:GNAT family N-acetyltransferase [Rothia halotolerans]|uniref:GNAT family N-acetyltransferase n=1 Tax=Rothia halotolerans TaxID=405770 RepID=UPI00101BFDD3|nr:GNAT family N-acetyltransferase [Rothia halotolerans]
MRFLRQRLDRVTGPTVRPLTQEDAEPLLTMIRSRPVANLFALEHFQRIGLPGSSFLTRARSASPFLGVFEPGGPSGAPRLAGAVWFGANLVPVHLAPAHLPRVISYVRSTDREISSIFGTAREVMTLGEGLEQAGYQPFDVRPEQPLLVLRADASLEAAENGLARGAGVSPVRWAHSLDVDALLPAAVAMFTEEVGYSPLARDAAGYSRRIAEGVAAGRTVLALDGVGDVVFKTDVGLAAEGLCQLQGVWLAPRLRGQGLSEGLLAEACRLIRPQHPTISLYVNGYNLRARALYRRVGFDQVDTFATVLF